MPISRTSSTSSKAAPASETPACSKPRPPPHPRVSLSNPGASRRPPRRAQGVGGLAQRSAAPNPVPSPPTQRQRRREAPTVPVDSQQSPVRLESTLVGPGTRRATPVAGVLPRVLVYHAGGLQEAAACVRHVANRTGWAQTRIAVGRAQPDPGAAGRPQTAPSWAANTAPWCPSCRQMRPHPLVVDRPAPSQE